jgi:phosphatidylinositol mannoside-binding LppM-like protein
VTLRARFDDPEEFATLTDGVHGALDDEDARLFQRLRLRRLDGGAVAFEGRVGLLLPVAPGARGEGIAFDADDLERLLEERGDELVRYEVRVTLPAAPREHDGDVAEGRSVTWRAPVGELRAISAVSQVPSRLPPWLVPALAVALVAAVVTAAVVVLQRRRRITSAG